MNIDDKQAIITFIGILLWFSLIFLLLIPSAFAYDPFKIQICEALNFSMGECDDWWDSYHGTEEEDFYNRSEIDSMFSNITIDLDPYYNRSEVDVLINETNATIIIEYNGTYITEEYFKNHTAELRNSIADNYAQKDDIDLRDGVSNYSSSGMNVDPMMIIIIILILAIGGGVLYMMKGQRANKEVKGKSELADAMASLKDMQKNKPKPVPVENEK